MYKWKNKISANKRKKKSSNSLKHRLNFSIIETYALSNYIKTI